MGELGRLTSEAHGDPATEQRKVKAGTTPQPLAMKQKEWLEEAVKTLILRAGASDRTAQIAKAICRHCSFSPCCDGALPVAVGIAARSSDKRRRTAHPLIRSANPLLDQHTPPSPSRPNPHFCQTPHTFYSGDPTSDSREPALARLLDAQSPADQLPFYAPAWPRPRPPDPMTSRRSCAPMSSYVPPSPSTASHHRRANN